VASEVEFLAKRASELAPVLGTESDWLRQAYEAVSSKVPKGVDPEPQMAGFLHSRCTVLKSRADGIRSLQAGVTQFRSRVLVPPEVQAVNRRRLQEAGGLTDDLKRELGQETYAEQRQREQQLVRDKSTAQNSE
jgi:hypothetical protein